MAAVSITSYALLDGVLPGRVSLVISDHADPEEATTLISLRLKSETPYKRSVLLSQREVLLRARGLIDEEIERLDKLHHSGER